MPDGESPGRCLLQGSLLRLSPRPRCGHQECPVTPEGSLPLHPLSWSASAPEKMSSVPAKSSESASGERDSGGNVGQVQSSLGLASYY